MVFGGPPVAPAPLAALPVFMGVIGGYPVLGGRCGFGMVHHRLVLRAKHHRRDHRRNHRNCSPPWGKNAIKNEPGQSQTNLSVR